MPIKTLKKIPHVRGDKIAIVLVCLGLGSFGAGGVIALDRVNSSATSAKEIAEATKQAQLFACERGNETRAALREEKNNEIAFIETIPKLVKAPPGTLNKYVETQKKLVEENRDKIFIHINCKKELNNDNSNSLDSN